MELKITFQDNNFIFSEELSDNTLKTYLQKYCSVFLQYKNFIDLNTFELILSTEKIDKRITNTKKFYFVRYNKREQELEYCYPISVLKKIMPSIAELDHNFFGYKKKLNDILGDFKKESFFLKVKLEKNTERIAYKPNVTIKDLKINKENYQHAIKYANFLGLENLVIDIIKQYIKKENTTFEECMSFLKENKNYEKYKSAIILSEF